jgi:Flp pilus assembly protein TadB
MQENPERASSIELSKLSKHLEFNTRERPLELEARLQRENDEANHRRSQERLILRAVIVVVGIVVVICVVVLFLPGPPPRL